MPLWSSSSRSSSYTSTASAASASTSPGGPPQLPPLPRFTPPSTSQLPHFEPSPALSKLSIASSSSNKGKQVDRRDRDGDHDDGDEEDDPWQDGSEDESTIKHKFTSPSSYAPPTSPSVKTPTSATNTTGSAGWFSSLTSTFVSPSANTLRRQPSAKDVALALTTTSNQQPLKRSQGSYIGKVNEVQKEADQIVQDNLTPSSRRPQQQRETAAAGPENARTEEVDETRLSSKIESSQKEKLKQSIRPDVFELVKDPTSVLPRLRREWLTRPCPPSSRSPSTSTPRNARPSMDDDDDDAAATARISISSQDDDDDQERRGYVPLNASALSSSTAKPVVDYQKEYGMPKGARTKGDDVLDSQEGTAGVVIDEETLEEEPGELGRENRRKKRFLDVLQGIKKPSSLDREHGQALGIRDGGIGGRDDGETDLGELRKLSWGGVPPELRVVVWMLLLGYLPSPFSRRTTTLARKRQEYADAVKMAFSRGVKGLDGPIWHQISIDVPRTRPGVKLWMVEGTQRSLERILYVWAIRHPASGYVQGINDLVTPFFQVFLSLYIDSDPEEFDPALLPPCALEALEADSFWCLSKLLDGIQDNYIFAQPGITRAVKKMENLCKRVDAPLAKHLQSEGVEFIQFAFRWMNCLLMRELSVKNIVRMWDTYLAEGGDAFSEFHLYVCLSFLVKWSEQLRTMDFQSIIMFLQSLPTKDWKDSNTELLLSEAFMWSRTFEAR